MATVRASENPIIRPEDIGPSTEGFEVIGVFNAGATRCGGEVILLLRVAERPINSDPETVLSACFDVDEDRIVTQAFSLSDPENDFSDSRLIVRTGPDVFDVDLAFTGSPEHRWPPFHN